MVRNPLKYLPLAGIIILFMAIGYFLIKAGYKGGNNAVLNEVLPEAGLTIKNFHSSQDDPDEGTSFVLDADEGTYSQDKQRVMLNNFRLKLELSNSASMEIKGNRADYDTNSKVINLSGNLQGNSSDGFKIFTEHLTYKQKEGVLKTDEPVRITGPFFSMTGKGLLCYPEKEQFEIISDVTTLIEQDL